MDKHKPSVCTFLNQHKQKLAFRSYKTCIFIVKNVKKQRGNTFPEMLVLISKNKIKGNSKWAIDWKDFYW